MSIIDWAIVCLPVLIVFSVAVYGPRHVHSVADFMSGNRSAGRYLLAIAGGEMQTGAVVFVATFELISQAGFTYYWWGWLSGPILMILAITGFVSYRYRQTRALTLAQFFEIRYSKSFRLFTGALAFFAGLLNFGIIPATGARALVYFLGLPPSVPIFSLMVPTYIILMVIFLTITLTVALSGGLVTVMLTNCFEGMISQIFFLIIIFTLIVMFPWSHINTVLQNRPPGHSMLNPFDTSEVHDFNVWNVVMGTCTAIIGTMTWQNAGAYNSAAFSPHEGRMGGILGRWREIGKGAVIVLLGVCAVTYLNHPAYAAQAAEVQAAVQQISDPHIQKEMRSSIALSHVLPVGVRGMLCAVLLMGIFGGDATHLHSWGSIFVQDILVPRRKKPFGPRQHIWVLRFAMIGVALFAFLFGILFPIKDYIFMWWGVTQAIFMGGAGAAIIGGLYWKKGTTKGAYYGLITGSTLTVGGILIQQFYGSSLQKAVGGMMLNLHASLDQVPSLNWLPLWAHHYHVSSIWHEREFFLNGTQIGFFSSITAVAVYIVVSLLTHKEDFNMDRMLHRGAYAAIKPLVGDAVVVPKGRVSWGRIIGFDEDYSVTDKWLAGGLFAWVSIFAGIFIVGAIWNQIAPWPISVWSLFWNVVALALPIFCAVVIGIWFTWGGLRDIADLFRRLRQERINVLDDGTVADHQNLDERAVETKLYRK
jgi:SSS family solute:Na+ symporter